MADAMLIYGDSFRSADMRHAVPLGVPDPFLYAEQNGSRYVFANSMEATRLRERPVIWSLLLVLAANVAVFWSLGASAANGSLTLLWPAPPGAPYALIVDGAARHVPSDGVIAVRPTRAVLHRVAGADQSLASCVTVL